MPKVWLKSGAEDHIQSLARGFAVVRAFGPGRERLTMAEVASACQLSRAAARRIMLTLEELGYLASDGRHFFLTSRILELGKGYSQAHLWEIVRPHLQEVVDELNETASAGVLDNFEVVYTLRLRSSRVLQLDLAPGAHVPAHASAIGRVLLAGLAPYQLSRYVAQAEFARYTPDTLADPETLRRRLDEVREQGWCYLTGEIEEGVGGAAVPLLGPAGDTLAALNVGVNPVRTSPQDVESRVIPRLKAAADAIAARL